ncbi:hypothetical protein CLOM_g2229 [Closterium sp. NIES-68]|nr:hypothetical protein CLOM_g2229 [Closterium sp. NIES-68]
MVGLLVLMGPIMVELVVVGVARGALALLSLSTVSMKGPGEEGGLGGAGVAMAEEEEEVVVTVEGNMVLRNLRCAGGPPLKREARRVGSTWQWQHENSTGSIWDLVSVLSDV